MTAQADEIAASRGCRYVLAVAGDAAIVAGCPDVVILGRRPAAVVVEADVRLAAAFAEAGQYISVFRSAGDALRALALFDTPPG